MQGGGGVLLQLPPVILSLGQAAPTPLFLQPTPPQPSLPPPPPPPGLTAPEPIHILL